MSHALAAAGLTQVAVAAVTGWPLAALTAQPELLERIGNPSLRRLRQFHVDLIIMGGLITAAGAASTPSAWAAFAIVIGGVTNPLLFLPLAYRPTLTRQPVYAVLSAASFAVTTAGWIGVAVAAWR